jgi:hypothetical protein
MHRGLPLGWQKLVMSDGSSTGMNSYETSASAFTSVYIWWPSGPINDMQMKN